MIPEHYFEVICCANCRSELEIHHGEEKLSCKVCKSTYPVVEDIPVLIDSVDDEVSRVIKQFYDSEWKKNNDGVLKAKAEHEDLSYWGQRYIRTNEDRFLPFLDPEKQPGGDQGFFLDAASGAQPREDFGSGYAFHICVDFSLDGLIESRRILGSRAICVCGSLLNIPLKKLSCDGVLASHVLYHIDKDRQHEAVRELGRVLRPEGKLLVLYRNPDSPERRLINMLKKVTARDKYIEKGGNDTFYYYAHPIKFMLDILGNEFGRRNVRVEYLRMFSRTVTQSAFKYRIPGKIVFSMIAFMERVFRNKPGFSSYVAYLVKK